MARRITTVERGAPVSIRVNGESVTAYTGETLATALLAIGVTEFHRTQSGRPRGPFCNMGVCFECVVKVDHLGWVRACMATVHDAMTVTTGVCLADRKFRTTAARDED